jgi:hypothetical protein
MVQPAGEAAVVGYAQPEDMPPLLGCCQLLQLRNCVMTDIASKQIVCGVSAHVVQAVVRDARTGVGLKSRVCM